MEPTEQITPNLFIWAVPTQDHLVMATGPHCIASAWTTENTASNSSSTVAYTSMAMVMWCLPSHCLAMGVSLGHCSLGMDVFEEPFHSNGCLFWFHVSGIQQTCHNIIWTYKIVPVIKVPWRCTVFLVQAADGEKQIASAFDCHHPWAISP
jgi:hypothetical protein